MSDDDEISYSRKVEEIAEIIEDIGNEWEIDFVESMQEWQGEFTEKQKSVIDRLYEKACESDL